MARGGASPEVRAKAADRVRQVVALRIRGISFERIGQQLGCNRQIAYKLFNKALRALPKADLEQMRKLEAERIADLRERVWADLAGKPDPGDRSKTIRPEGETLATLVNAALRISRHEAVVFGLDAPTKSAIISEGVGRLFSPEEIDIQMARLTDAEQDTFMMLIAKMDGRWVEPPAIDEGSGETTATTAQSNGAGS